MRDAFPLINRPDRQSRARRWTFRVLTTLAWLIWLYLWLPAATLFAWVMGYKLLERVLFTDADLFYLRTLTEYGLWIAGLALAFMLWSAYNLRRFRGRERRRAVPVVDAAAVAADLPLSTEAVEAIMHSRKVQVIFDDKGLPSTARVAMHGDERGRKIS